MSPPILPKEINSQPFKSIRLGTEPWGSLLLIGTATDARYLTSRDLSESLVFVRVGTGGKTTLRRVSRV